MDPVKTSLEENNNGKTREQVQDFIEKLINSMLGQNIDDANVTKLYNDKGCKYSFLIYKQVNFNNFNFHRNKLNLISL